MIEHCEPLTLVLRELVSGPHRDSAAVADLLARALHRGAVITPQQHAQLASAGLANRMPPDWQPGDDPWERYRRAGLDPATFEPLEEVPRGP